MKYIEKFIPYILIITILIGVFIVWKTNPIDYEMYRSDTISYVKAEVISVNSEMLEDSPDMPGRAKGMQNITVRFTEGKNEGKEVTFDNLLSDTHSVEVDAGTKIIVKCDEPTDVEPYYTVYQYDRTGGLALAFLIFFVLICAVGKFKGLKAGIALLVTMIIIAGAMIPLIYNGKDPILVTFAVCIAITAVTLVLLNGFSAKTLVAVLSTMIGLLVSVLFYYLISGILNVSGYSVSEAEELILISRSTGLKIKEVMFAGILLGCLGAVMDTAMSIASSLFEIISVNPKMKKKELFSSGINIGRDMIGTMCQTLVLAFVGSSVASLLIMLAYGTRVNQFLSSDYLATEVLQALTGSFAVILAVPITASLCASLHKKKAK